MRVTRPPVRTPYRPTPIPPPTPGRPTYAATLAPKPQPAVATRRWNPSETQASKSGVLPVIVIVTACLLLLGVTVVGTISLVRTYDLTPVALMRMIPGLGASRASSDMPPAGAKPAVAAVKPTAPRPQPRTLTSRAWQFWTDVPDGPDFLDPTVAAPQSFQTTRTFQPGFEFIEGGMIQADQTRIRLGWIASLPATAVCMSDQSTKFACGLMARASLSVLAAKEPLVCYPDVSLATENPQFLCQSHGRDLSLAQIEAGFALPAYPSLPGLVKLEGTARTERAGAWNGDWNIIPPGGPSTTPANANASPGAAP